MYLAKTENQKSDGFPIRDFEIIFHFKKPIEDNDLKILSEISSIRAGIINTKTAIVKKTKLYCLHFITDKNTQLELKDFTDIDKKYAKILNKISLSENSKYHHTNYINKKDRQYLRPQEIEIILSKFLEKVSNIELEIILSDIILNSNELVLTEKEFKQYKLSLNAYNTFRNLFVKNKPLLVKDIEKIILDFSYINLILQKQIIYLIKKKSNLGLDDLEKLFKKAKGKELYNSFERSFIAGKISDFHAKLELFSLKYSLSENIIDQIRNKSGINSSKIRIEIPLKPDAYEFEKYYLTGIANDLTYCFRNKPELVLECFKNVMVLESKRILGLDIKNKLLICFSYERSPENIAELKKDNLYFIDLKRLVDEKSEIYFNYDKSQMQGTQNLKFFTIFHGYSQENRRINRTKVAWERIFYIKDCHGNDPFVCKITKNKEHFKHLKLNMEDEIEIQALLNVSFQYLKSKDTWIIKEKFFEIIDITLLDHFEAISIELGRHFNGVKKLENTRDGIYIYKYPMSGNVYHTKVMDAPIILLNVYKRKDELYYQIKLPKEIITKTQHDIANYIQKYTPLAYFSGSRFSDSIIKLLGELAKGMPVLPMFNTVGVFVDKNKELILAHPENPKIKVIGENDIQADVIENIEMLGLDTKGDLIKDYFEILHIPTTPESFRLGVYGYAAIHPFFFVIRKVLDIFPNLFAIGVHGSGKTTLLELLINILFGTKLKLVDNIESVARATKFATESTFANNIDDIDGLEDKLMNFIKGTSTRKTTRDRLRKDNTKLSEQIYVSYTGSANSKQFIMGSKNDAFRQRCMLFELNKRIDIKEDTLKFEEIRLNIIDNKIAGFYLLEKAIEFIEKSSNKGNLTTYYKLTKLVKETKGSLKKLLISQGIELCDTRRLTMYALIYIGWQFWDYCFKSKELESPLLKKALNFETGCFFEYIKELENAEREISLEIFDNILQFYIQNRFRYQNRETTDGKIVLQRDFQVAYDAFAKQRGYDSLNNLTKLGQLQSEILNREIKAGTLYFEKKYESEKGNFDVPGERVSEYGIIFYFNEISEMRKRISPAIEIKEHNVGKVDLDRVFIGQTKTELTKLQNLIDFLKNLFDELDNEFVEKASIIQVLNNDFEKEFVINAINNLINEGTLIEKDNSIKFQSKS